MSKKFWIVVVSLSVLLAALCLLRLSSFKETEQDIIAALQQMQSPASVLFFQIISDYGKYINIGIPAVFLIVGLIKKRREFTIKALTILLAMSLAGVIAQTIKRTVKEPRPYEVDSRIQQWGYGGSNSFPSGHTAETTVAALGFALLLFNARWIILLSALWAGVMMLSRIVLGVHNFTDIFGGIVTACLAFYIVHTLFDRSTRPGIQKS